MTVPMAEILVVDDDDDIRDAISSALCQEGYNVAAVGDGLEALDYLRSAPHPSLILLDMRMPRMDGAEFCAVYAEDPDLSTIPLVLVTAEGGADRRRGTGVARSILSKPVSLERLLEVVEKFCQRP